MKKLLITFVLLAGIYFSADAKAMHRGPVMPQQVNISFQVFYDQLSPYGTWISNSNYGYVWVPAMGSNFIPYATGGHWEYSDDFGWLWVSDYAWGWAPFHYGNWYFDNIYGWMWVPGYNWSPAWVVWGSYGNNYGWAPIGPGVTITAGYMPPPNYWNFVPYRHIHQHNVYNYRVRNTTIVNNNITIINNTRVYNNHRYYAGPQRGDVERYSGRKVTPVRVAESTRPGATRVSKNQVTIYRPAVTREADGKRAAPAKVVQRESLRPVGNQSPNAPERNAPRGNDRDARERISNDRDNQPGKNNANPNTGPRQTTPERQPNRSRGTEQQIPRQQQQPSRQPGQPRNIEQREMQRNAPKRQEMQQQQPDMQKQQPRGNMNQPQQQRRKVQPQPQQQPQAQPPVQNNPPRQANPRRGGPR